MNFCTDCGEYTTNRSVFGDILCGECHQRQDDAVEGYERREANRFGYDQGYYARLDRLREAVKLA